MQCLQPLLLPKTIPLPPSPSSLLPSILPPSLPYSLTSSFHTLTHSLTHTLHHSRATTKLTHSLIHALPPSLQYSARHAQPPLNKDQVLRFAFQRAYRITRWRLGVWGWYYVDRTEEEMLGQLVVDKCNEDCMGPVYEKIPGGRLESKIRHQVRPADSSPHCGVTPLVQLVQLVQFSLVCVCCVGIALPLLVVLALALCVLAALLVALSSSLSLPLFTSLFTALSLFASLS